MSTIVARKVHRVTVMKPRKQPWPTGALPKGTRVRFTVEGLGASPFDELWAVTPERYGPSDAGTVAFPHPNQKFCKDYVFVRVASKIGPARDLYVGVSPNMIEPAGEDP